MCRWRRTSDANGTFMFGEVRCGFAPVPLLIMQNEGVLRGASNAKAKRELAWQPGHPSWREGFAAA